MDVRIGTGLFSLTTVEHLAVRLIVVRPTFFLALLFNITKALFCKFYRLLHDSVLQQDDNTTIISRK